MLIGIKEVGKPNKINYTQADLPYPIRKGSISVSLNFESQPSGNINITDIPESEINAYRAAYNVINKNVTLFSEYGRGIAFEISAYAETEDAIFIDNTQIIRSYSISVNLRGRHERNLGKNYKLKGRRTNITLATLAGLSGISYTGYSYRIDIPQDAGSDYELNFQSLLQDKLRVKSQIVDFSGSSVTTKNYLSGKTHSVSAQDIIYAIELNKSGKSYYKDTELTINTEDNSDLDLGDGKTRLTPVKLVLEEGDADPDKPPLDVKDINSLDLCFDFSGPRKTKKVTTLLNGQPFEEEIWIYGFAYLGHQIRNPVADTDAATYDTKALLANENTSPNLEELWQVIEYQKTTHIYQDSQYDIRITAKDPETNETYPVRYLGSQRFDSRYLTGIVTKGWKLNRFQQEQYDDSGNNSDFDSRTLNDQIDFLSNLAEPTADEELELSYVIQQLKAITFRKLEFSSKTQYKLSPKNEYYEDAEAIPFETQLVSKESLGISGDGEVIAAIPDSTFALPMISLEEKTLKQSFDQMDHPQNIFIRAEREEIQNDNTLTTLEKEERLKETKLLPWLTTGEDSYYAVTRKIIPSTNTSFARVGKNSSLKTDIYVEYETNASSQDTKFQNSLQEIQYRTIAGRPPDATVFSFEYKDKNEEEKEDDEPYNYKLLLNSSNRSASDATELIESVSYNTANEAEGVRAAKVDLEINNFLNTTETSINLAWWYPTIRPGDYLNFIDDASKQNYRVKSVSLNLNIQGYVAGELLYTSDGTNITCGQFDSYGVSVRRKKPEDGEGDADNFEVSSTVTGADYFNPNIYPDIKTRRNPNNEELDLDDPTPEPPLG